MELTGLAAVLPGYTVRPVSLDDVPLLYDLVSRVNMADLGRVDTTQAELRDDLGGPHFDRETDTLLAVAPDGRAAAYGQGHDERTGVGWVDVYVDPALPTFDEVADAAIVSCCTRVTESVQKRGESAVKLTSNLYEVEERMRAAYERQEFRVETVYWRMGLRFADIARETPTLSEAYEIHAVDPNDEQVMAQGYELYRDTFSEHHGAEDSDISLNDFGASWRAQESFDPHAWWFAFDDGEPIGMLMGDNRRVEQGDGYVRNLGVRKALRGQGIARALLLTAFGHWRDEGRTGAQLGVDTANVTGATRLYESVGMRSLLSAIALARTVTF